MIAITFSFQNIFKIKDTWEIADRRETTILPKILPSLRNSILGISSRKVWETFENSTFRSQNVFPRPNVYISPPSLYNVYKTTMYISHGGRYGSTCVDKVQRGFEKKKKRREKNAYRNQWCSCATGITMTRCGVCDAVQNESVGASRLSPWVTSGPPPDSTSSDAGQMFPIISYARNLLLPRQQPEKGLAVGATMGESRFRTGLLIDSLALSDAIYRHGNPLRLSLYLLSLLLLLFLLENVFARVSLSVRASRVANLHFPLFVPFSFVEENVSKRGIVSLVRYSRVNCTIIGLLVNCFDSIFQKVYS